jgi:methylenetetrahydrofolate reductase (NADPH)
MVAQRVLSVEVFPPKTEAGAARLHAMCVRLAALGPDYISVTSGVGPVAAQRTREVTAALRDALAGAIEVVPHITGIGSTSGSIRELLAAYRRLGFRHVVALRGDVPPGLDASTAELRHGSDVVALVRAEAGSDVHVEVAGYPEFHPEAPSADADLDHLRRKVDAGADAVLTQYFYNADAYARFVESCRRRGLTVPIVPGIMPIVNYERLARFSDAAGVEIPRWLRKRLDGLSGDPVALEAFGSDVVTSLCRRLLDEGAPGLHFYTMNRDEPTATIWRRLGLAGRRNSDRAGPP